MSKKKRIIWLDQLKAFAFYLVIVGHMSIPKNLGKWIYSFHMPLFLMISGFTLNIEKVRQESFWNYLVKNVTRLLVPYFWLQMLSFVLRYLINICGLHKEVNVPKMFIGIFVGNNILVNSPSNPSYYILLLFLAQIGLWFVLKLTKGDKRKIAVTLAVLSIFSMFTYKKPMIWHINIVPTAMLFIFIGVILRDCYYEYKDYLQKLSYPRYFLIIAGLILFGFVTSRLNGSVSIHQNKGGREYLVFIMSSVATSIAMAMIFMIIPKIKFISFVGQNTLFYLGIHKPILLVLETIFKGKDAHPLFLILGSIFVFVGLAPVALFASKYMPYICGLSIKENTKIIDAFKYIVIALSGAVPWLFFNNHFMDGLLRESVGYQILSALIFMVIVVVAKITIQKLFPFMFIEERKKKLRDN